MILGGCKPMAESRRHPLRSTISIIIRFFSSFHSNMIVELEVKIPRKSPKQSNYPQIASFPTPNVLQQPIGNNKLEKSFLV